MARKGKKTKNISATASSPLPGSNEARDSFEGPGEGANRMAQRPAHPRPQKEKGPRPLPEATALFICPLARTVSGSSRFQFVGVGVLDRSEEHTSELQSLMRISYAVFFLKQKN